MAVESAMTCEIGSIWRHMKPSIEGLYDAVRTYTRTTLPRRLVSFCMARYREKQQQQQNAWTFDLLHRTI